MKNIIITKNINPSLINTYKNINFIEIPLIKIVDIDYQEIEQQIVNCSLNYIVSSKNSINVIKKFNLDGKFYVVGKSTFCTLKELNKNVVLFANSSKELAEMILMKNINNFTYLGSNIKRQELINLLKKNNIKIDEIDVYKTELILKKIDIDYDGIVFFSPSGVESFFKKNKIKDLVKIFAIGETTKNEIIKYTKNEIYLPSYPNVDRLLHIIDEVFN